MATPGSPYPVSANAEPRDLFLSYNSRDREAVLQVRQALTLRQVSSFFDRADLTVGQLWFDELEVALRSVRGVAVFIGKDRLGTIQKREMQFALARQAAEEIKGRKFPVIPILLAGADPDFFSGFLALNTWVDLREKISEPGALDGVIRALRVGAEPPPVDGANAVCPYRSLNAFREEDSPIFFGREAFSQRLYEQVAKNPVVAVVGRSGSGKSSVVQAGLLPRLRRERPPAQTWEGILFTPGGKPFHRLAAQLVSYSSPCGRDFDRPGNRSRETR